MLKILAFPFCMLVLIVPSCRTMPGTPLEIDTESGMATLDTPDGPSLQFSTWLDGANMFRGAHVFRDKGNLVAIHSRGELDLVSTFAFDSAGMYLSLQLINSAKERRDVRELRLLKILPVPAAVISSEGFHRARIESVPGSSVGLCLETAAETQWNLELEATGSGLECRLDLSSSSLVLLPGERILLPTVSIYYHLCSDPSVK